jgi:hypothetical protein
MTEDESQIRRQDIFLGAAGGGTGVMSVRWFCRFPEFFF